MNDEQFPNLIQELFTQAEQDGVITEDERKIIDQVKIDLKLFNSAHEKALADNIIDEEESRNLQKLRDNILERAIEKSKADGYVERDERDLLKKLLKVIRNIVNIQSDDT